MDWKKWKHKVESQGVKSATEVSDVYVTGGYLPRVTIAWPDPDPASSHTVATIATGAYEGDIDIGTKKDFRKPPKASFF